MMAPRFFGIDLMPVLSVGLLVAAAIVAYLVFRRKD